jgi:hypothetical protein
MKSKVAILRTHPSRGPADYHELLNLADYRDTIALPDAIQR